MRVLGLVGRGQLLLMMLLVSGKGWAQPSGGAEPASSATASRSAERRLSLELHSDSADVTFEAVRAAVASELGVEVIGVEGAQAVAGPVRRLTVSYRPAQKELAVSFSAPLGSTVTRVVESPATAAEVITTAALLAANLAHYEPEPAAPATEPASVPSPLPGLPVTPAPSITTTYLERRPEPRVERVANASFFYPLATNLDQPELKTHLSFNLLYGRIGELDGLELGAFNSVSGNVAGVQIGLVGNISRGRVAGAQIGTAFSSAGAFEGIQLSALVNRVAGATSGAQLAFLANVDGGNLEGGQLGLFNRAADVAGVQLGLINIAARVRGVQLGLINVADDVDGAPIGLVSVTRSGGVHPLVWGSNVAYVNVAIKFATRYTYTFFGMSGHREPGDTQLGPTFGIGFAAPVVKQKLFFEPDITALHLFGDTKCCDGKLFGAHERRKDHSQLKLRSALRYQIAKHFSLFAGAGVVGSLRYPTNVDNDTQYSFATLVEGFGGIQL